MKIENGRDRIIRWPEDIPRVRRQPIDSKHGSFLYARMPGLEDDGGYDRQIIRVKGHVLILSVTGTLVVEREDMKAVLGEGDACVFSNQEFGITEIPPRSIESSEAHFFFFDDRVVSDLVGKNRALEEAIADYWLPLVPIVYLPNLGETVSLCKRNRGLEYPTEFRSVFCLAHRESAVMNGFLKHGFFRRAAELRDFLDTAATTPVNWPAVEAAYPGGRRALRADCKLYFHMTPQEVHSTPPSDPEREIQQLRDAETQALMTQTWPRRRRRRPKGNVAG